MYKSSVLRRLAALLASFLIAVGVADTSKAARATQKDGHGKPRAVSSARRGKLPSPPINRPAGVTASNRNAAPLSNSARSAKASCDKCGGDAITKRAGRGRVRGKRLASKARCHPKDYVDPKIARNLNAALRDMKRAGIKPKITSAWRSSGDQAYLHRCQYSRRCRVAHGVYGAMPAGKSMHEAGFAVDIAGVAAGRRDERHITRQGRRVVQIMKRNGFNWRYGLADPAHFEADPRRHGYRNTAQAIKLNQTRCQIKLAQAKKSQAKPRKATDTHARRAAANRNPHRGSTVQAAAKKPSKPGSRV